MGSSTTDLYSLTEWLQKIKMSNLSEKVEDLVEQKELDQSMSQTQTQETDMTTEELKGGPAKRKRRSSSCELLQSSDTLDLTKNFQKNA